MDFGALGGRAAVDARRTALVFGEIQPSRSRTPMASARARAATMDGSLGPATGGYPRAPTHEGQVHEVRDLHRSSAVGSVDCLEKPSPTTVVKSMGTRETAATVGGGGGGTEGVPARPLSCDLRRGLPLVEWIWASNSSPSAISEMQDSAVGVSPDGAGKSCHEIPKRQLVYGSSCSSSSVVVGKVCEPVRPTRLDLATSEGV